MRRRLFFLVALVFLACGPPPDSERPVGSRADTEVTGPLRLASGLWAPFTDVPGKPRIAVDLVHEALRRSGVEARTSLVHPQELMGALKAGEYEGSEALWFTEERKKYLIYSEPYLENRLVLLGRSGADVSAENLEALGTKKLGIVEGYAYGPQILEASGPTLVRGPSDEENLRTLLKGGLDCILVDALLVYYLFEYSKEEANKRLVAGQQAMATRSLHFAVRRDRKDARKIIDGFNAEIADMTRDGTYHKVLRVSWLVADMDGDGREEVVLQGSHIGQDPPAMQYHLSGAVGSGAPRFMVEGEVYSDWDKIPERYKSTTDDPVDRFKPGINAVLFEF